MHSDSKKRRSFVTLLFAAGDLRRWFADLLQQVVFILVLLNHRFCDDVFFGKSDTVNFVSLKCIVYSLAMLFSQSIRQVLSLFQSIAKILKKRQLL